MQGIEIGSGFSGSQMLGSEHNDEFYMEDGHVRTRTNRYDRLLKCIFGYLTISLKVWNLALALAMVPVGELALRCVV